MKQQYIKINEYGHKFYYSDREMTIRHREDGPAIEYADGDKWWYLNGRLHREDGPAIEYTNGLKSWYLYDNWITEAEHARRTRKETILTIDEIAAKFGISVEGLKITK
jgi:hypothetical protein